ncbi:MAG: nucleoside 2-deoxyribosyltransferase [Candidatus Hodarchaeota archaeon]
MLRKRSLRIYLSGPVFNTSDEDQKWRQYVKKEILAKGFEVIDPLELRDYRGLEEEKMVEIVEKDLKDLKKSDILLIYAPKPSWGTAMEIVYAYLQSKQIITVAPEKEISPWLKYHTDILVSSFKELLEVLEKIKQS